MPELPDIMVYIEALERTVLGQQLEGIRIASPFLVRSIAPPMESFAGRPVSGCNRLGKRIVMEFDGDYFLVLHLMIAGRIRWKKRGAGLPGRIGLAAFDFPNGTLLLTEAGSKRRASLYAVRGRDGLAAHDRGGVDVLRCTLEQFRQRLVAGNHTLKRALCDPSSFSGIGNAYSDVRFFTPPVYPHSNSPAISNLTRSKRCSTKPAARSNSGSTGSGNKPVPTFPTK